MDVGSATFSGRIHYLRIICASACLSVWLSNHLSPICLIHHVFFTWLMSNSVLWSPDNKIWLIGKDPDARKDWGQEEKRAAEDEKAGWHHWLSAHEFEKSLENSAGQGSLVCCSPWGRKGSDMTEWLNWTELIQRFMHFSEEWTHKNSDGSIHSYISFVLSKPREICIFSQCFIPWSYLPRSCST